MFILFELFGTHWTYLVLHERKIIPLRVMCSCKVHAGVKFLAYLLNLVSADVKRLSPGQ